MIQFDPRARADLEAAIEWYDGREPAIGDRFLARFDHLLERVSHHPHIYPKVEDDVRRALMSQFPYAVYYVSNQDCIDVLAVLHTSRRPDYWRDRAD